jgi:sodium/hydrogen exchanger-like protein 6/7/sodium/hydrogen exchanger 8
MFFRNLGNVALFGLVVTLVNFVLFGLATVWVVNQWHPAMYNYATLGDEESPVVANPQGMYMSTMQMLLFAALVCSSDVVAAVSIVDYKAQPKLFSCIFGEGIANDIVSIIIFNTVLYLQGQTFEAYTPFLILA